MAAQTSNDGTPKGNPKDSMKSTWRTDRTQWTIDHYLFWLLNLFDHDLDKPVPVHEKTDPVPYLTSWSTNLFIIVRALWPLGIQYALQYWMDWSLSPYAAYLLYIAAMEVNSITQVHVMRRLGHRYGYLDGDKHARDEVPDVGVFKALTGLTVATFIRPLMMILLSYHRDTTLGFSWLLPVELAAYSIVLDFFFYCYHRACHEVDFLWRYHRTHHLTKHPNPMLSAYADLEQDFIEIVAVPVIAWGVLKVAGFPFGFYDWWMCNQFVVFAESWGHSGLRLYNSMSGTSTFLLKPFECDLLVEDHDLHHRNGWRKSYNYGKQTRLWDKLFGTCGPRIELQTGNVDFDHKVNIPLI